MANNPFGRVARWLSHGLEDVLSVRADRLGPRGWIRSSRDGRNRAEQEVDPVTVWTRLPPIGMAGVACVVDGRIRMLRPNFSDEVDPRFRLALIMLDRFRRLAYPRAPRALPHWWRRVALGAGGHEPTEEVLVPGRLAVLGNRRNDHANYYHFWMDTIGDLAFLRETLPPERQPDRFLVAHGGTAWQEEILAMVGVRDEQVIRFTDHYRMRVDEVVVPIRDKGGDHLLPGLVDAIRQTVARPITEPSGPTRLYVSRAESPRRRLENESAVRRLLTSRGFEVRQLTGLSVREQIDLFAAAEVVVAPHGAGLTNLMWCREGTRVIELLPDRHRVPCFLDICVQRGLRHETVVCSQEGPERGLTAPMLAPLDELERRVDRLLSEIECEA